MIESLGKQRLWLWFVWAAFFYTMWAILVFGLNHWNDVKEHWPIALAMAFGSYTAGSTPMGGGAVGFPVLVAGFNMSASFGRDFSFAIQAIGMSSASILILVLKQPLASYTLYGAILGSLIGTPIGLFYVAPYVSELWIKMAFATMWASFGILHLYRIKEISAYVGMNKMDKIWDFKVGLVLSLLATTSVTSVTGVGVDMVIYSALVLLSRSDLKIAIPTSVIIMAFTSILGVFCILASGGFQVGIFENWLAASPIVVLGAPLGALVVSFIGRKPTLFIVAILCVVQYIWICVIEYPLLNNFGVALSCIAVAFLLIVFEILRTWGRKLNDGHQDIDVFIERITK